MTPAQLELVERHGTPDQFRAACWNACCQLFVTVEEFHAAADKYDAEFATAGKSASLGRSA